MVVGCPDTIPPRYVECVEFGGELSGHVKASAMHRHSAMTIPWLLWSQAETFGGTNLPQTQCFTISLLKEDTQLGCVRVLGGESLGG